jgi:hypothetical protein
MKYKSHTRTFFSFKNKFHLCAHVSVVCAAARVHVGAESVILTKRTVFANACTHTVCTHVTTFVYAGILVLPNPLFALTYIHTSFTYFHLATQHVYVHTYMHIRDTIFTKTREFICTHAFAYTYRTYI